MPNLNLFFLRRKNHNPIVFNLILWVMSFIILLLSFSPDNLPQKIDYMYTGSFLSTIVIPVLINLYILIPRFLKKEKYTLYTLFFIINLLLFTQLNIRFFESLIDFIFPDYYFVSYHSNTKLITIFGVFLIGTTLIKLSEDWFYFNRNENYELKARNQQIQTQLASLRSQINPHFLFNSLNVIYDLAIDKKEKTKDAIVQLSDILRYIIYDSDAKMLLLRDELNLIKNYIEFHKFRSHNFSNVSFNCDIENDNYPIYPMLLLPLIENSFKHSNGDSAKSFIKIDIKQKKNCFHFNIQNNNLVVEENTETEHSGIGLKNIKKNLELVYPKEHTFNITEANETFNVDLILFKTPNL